MFWNNLSMLVLASASPRRRELLVQAGFTFEVQPSSIPEDVLPGERPADYVTRLSRQKAEAVFARYPSSTGLVVLGADTTVVVEGEILGKPADAADAARMLHLLSGKTHQVITGVSVVSVAGVESVAETTQVRFAELEEEEIQAYIATGEPMDKAGAYAIQGRAARWIPWIEGCYFNVVGLPVARTAKLLETALGRLQSQIG